MSLRVAVAAMSILFSITGWTGVTVAQPEPIGIVSDETNEVYRRYAAQEDEQGAVWSGKPMSLYSFGMIESNEIQAEQSMRALSSMMEELALQELENLEAESGIEIESAPPTRVDLPLVGDETFALRIDAQYGFAHVEVGLVLIRDGAWIQLLGTVAFVDNGSTIAFLVEVAQAAKNRWPNDSAIRVRNDGLRYGGIWGMAALPEEVPSHLRVDRTYESGPGPSSPKTPTAEPPVLPTPTSEPVGAEDARTGTDASSRLGQPFDVAFRIILAGQAFQATAEGGCSGSGDYEHLRAGGQVSLKTADGTELLIHVTDLTPGFVSYDLQLDENVCVFEVQFRNVPPRADYLLSSHSGQIATFSYSELSTGGTIEVVVLGPT